MQSLTAETILTDEIFDELFSVDDEVERTKLYLELTDRASELGVKGKFEKLYTVQLKAFKKYLKALLQPTVPKQTATTLLSMTAIIPPLTVGMGIMRGELNEVVATP